MLVEPLPIRGAHLLRGLPHSDERGTFWRAVDMEALAGVDADVSVAQISVGCNLHAGTVRGLHYQVEPHAESKTLWCSRGSAYDVLVDLRPAEPTFGRPWTYVLSSEEAVALHVPPGVAHGYQSLVDDTEITYVISTPYEPASARSVSAKDPALAIQWPLPVSRMSARDREAPPWPPSP